MLLRLDLSSGERWTELLPGFSVLHVPVTTAILTEAMQSVTSERPKDAIDDLAQVTVAITKFVARSVIRDWRGAVDDATGAPIAPSPDAIDAVMEIFPVYQAFNARIIDARIRIDREKKGLPVSPDGTSAAGPDIARPATDPAPSAPGV